MNKGMAQIYHLMREGRTISEQTAYLLEQGKMVGKPLGACLDSARWGSQQTVMYELSVTEMVGFITNWVSQNGKNFPKLLEDPRYFAKYDGITLPFIAYSNCPKEKGHTKRVKDRSGLVRCGHIRVKKFNPEFVQVYPPTNFVSGLERTWYVEEIPSVSEEVGKATEWARENRAYLEAIGRFEDQSRKTEEVNDPCYAVISDENVVMPLETVLRRLAVSSEFLRKSSLRLLKDCQGDDPYQSSDQIGVDEFENPQTEFPFDGWGLANYVQLWFEQTEGNSLPDLFERRAHLPKVRNPLMLEGF